MCVDRLRLYDAGLKAARARGRNGGRPKALTDHQLVMAKMMPGAPEVSVQQVAEHFGIARSTLYRALQAAESGEASR